ncbi:MAG: hypothetical protein JW934_03465 [Anaerolineae bacterium]|nr:hypothetical protein [Anaerolineae bacterium]
MIKQLSSKHRVIGIIALALVLMMAACNPFGGSKAAPTATFTPPPTETPLMVLPTYTPTPAAEQATNTPVVAAEEKPTLTPTPETQTQPPVPEVGGKEPGPVPVVYKVTTVPQIGQVLANGSFEEGFADTGAATGWSNFDNDRAVYKWVDELNPAHVSHGQHAQLMQVMGPGEADRFVGIYQTIEVVAGETYTVSLHGIIKASTANNSNTPYGHRIQWAVDQKGRGNWAALDWGDWIDTGWNDVPLNTENPTMNAYTTQITPESGKITLFVRGWTKWPILGSEAKYYIDGIFLEGPVPGEEKTITVVTQGGDGTVETEMPTTGGTGIWIPILGVVLVLGFAAWEIRKSWAR